MASSDSFSDGSLLEAQMNLVEASGSMVEHSSTPSSSSRTVDEVWREIVSGENKKKKEQFRLKEEAPDAVMTLEDFLLARTGGGDVKKEEEAMSMPMPTRRVRKGSGGDAAERAAMQRHRRMIKNRESAARSRERKQAYQVELESIALRLEEEHHRLLALKAQRSNHRLRQIMEKVFPVEEKRRPRRLLRRVRSFEW